jgi:acyl carrier protein
MVADLNLTAHFATRGIEVIRPDQGMRFLGHLMAQNTAQAMVLSADWRKLFEYQPKVAPMLAHLADQSESSDPSDSRNTTADFLETLLIAESAEQDALMTDHIQSLAARVFRMDREKIDISESLSAFGLDSMMAMELKGRVELTLRVPISVLELLKGVSIGDLSKSLLAKVRDQHSEIIQMLDGLSEEPAAPMQESPLMDRVAA